jgi:pimeloyl-ACP methyl ester carboxylesterase
LVARRLTAAVLLVLALPAGCAGHPAAPAAGPGGRTPSPSPSAAPPTPVAVRCGPPDTPASTFTLTNPAGVRLAAVEAGTGGAGVVLIHESGARGLCGWWPYASYLSQRGFHVLLFDHECAGDSDCPAGGAADADLMSDITAAVTRLHADGGGRIVLLGASQGAAEAVIAGSAAAPGITGVVALSADELTTPLAGPPYPATAADAAPQLRVPALFAVAADDRYVSLADTRALVGSVASPDRRLVELPAGAGHGWDLVAGDSTGARPAFSDTLVDFLTRHT